MDGVGYGELVEVETGDGPSGEGQVLELDGSTGRRPGASAEPSASDAAKPPCSPAAAPPRTGVGADYFGRVLDGAGRPRDGGPQPVPDDYRHVNGLPLNPIARAHPDRVHRDRHLGDRRPHHARPRPEAADLLRLPACPAHELAARIAAQARVPGDDAEVRRHLRRDRRHPAARPSSSAPSFAEGAALEQRPAAQPAPTIPRSSGC